MADIEVYIDLQHQTKMVGTMYCNVIRGNETISFSYDESWLKDTCAFSLEPALMLTKGVFSPIVGQRIFGSLGDSAPDTWGRRLMQRAERRQANQENRQVRTLTESHYLLGVADETRLGALRFRRIGEDIFQSPMASGVPAIIELGKLLQITERIVRDEETDDDFRLIFAPGSSLGGARPKASILDQYGHLSIAKFPKDNDDYSIETWEAIALTLARQAQIETADFQLLTVANKKVFLSKRFDRQQSQRIPFLSAMAMMHAKDGERGSYPEMVDALTRFGAQAKKDVHQLYWRVVFNVLISNVDDHLRNHGFLWQNNHGWRLSPAYDLNPVPSDVKARILSTNIDLDEGTCDIDLLLSAAGFFNLSLKQAHTIIKEVASVTKTWRQVAINIGANPREIDRMSSAFEHDDLKRALTF